MSFMELGKSQDKVFEYEQKKEFKYRTDENKNYFCFHKKKKKPPPHTHQDSNSQILIQVLLKSCSGTAQGKSVQTNCTKDTRCCIQASLLNQPVLLDLKTQRTFPTFQKVEGLSSLSFLCQIVQQQLS